MNLGSGNLEAPIEIKLSATLIGGKGESFGKKMGMSGPVQSKSSPSKGAPISIIDLDGSPENAESFSGCEL